MKCSKQRQKKKGGAVCTTCFKYLVQRKLDSGGVIVLSQKSVTVLGEYTRANEYGT